MCSKEPRHGVEGGWERLEIIGQSQGRSLGGEGEEGVGEPGARAGTVGNELGDI